MRERWKKMVKERERERCSWRKRVKTGKKKKKKNEIRENGKHREHMQKS